MTLVQSSRIFLGERGNKCEEAAPLMLYIVLLAITIFAVLFFMLWQTFVVLVDLIAGGIFIGVLGLELVIAGLTWISFL